MTDKVSPLENIIDFEAARDRKKSTGPVNPLVRALDVLALALVEHGHQWTDEERNLYELAIDYLQPGAPA